MFKKRISVAIVIALTVSVGLCGCAGKESAYFAGPQVEQTEQATPNEQIDQVAQAVQNVSEVVSYPITITDQMGRKVEIAEAAQKIASVYYISTSALMAMGCSDRLIGVESNADKRAIYNLSDEHIISLPSVGSPKELDFEACAALEPDVIFLPKRAKDNVSMLEELGLTVVVVNPESTDELKGMLELMGQITDSTDKAAELIGFIDENTQVLSDKLADVEPVSVYFGGNSNFLSTAPSGMYQNDMIALAGGSNVANEIDDTYWVESSYEQILDWNPAYIILASDAKYTVDDVLGNEALSSCDAVVNGNVFQLPSKAESWDSPVPGSILGAMWLANVLHPDIIGEDYVADLIETFYNTYYGFSYSEN